MKNNRVDERIIGTANVTVDILPKGYCVPDRKLNTVGYITIHNTGSMAPAKNQHNYMKNINKSGERKASWHFSVDDKDIHQAQSCNFEMWHCGDTTGNKNSIGIEMCQSDNKDTQEKIYRNAIELVKILMKYYNVSITKVVQHNKWSGKNCPQYLRENKYGFNWNWFIEQCKGNSNSTNSSSKIKDGDYENKEARVVKVKSNDVLYIRYFRNPDSKEVGQLKPGTVVTCQYCKNGWMSIDWYKGDKGLGYVNSYYLELI
jgi:N-acetylmuramoyl-L-alanine amidase CwlA